MVANQKRYRMLPLPLVLVATVVLLALGTWQVQRLQWKTATIETIKRHSAEEPLALDCDKVYQDVGSMQFRPAQVTGTFNPQQVLYLYAGPYKFKGQQGYRIFSPITCSAQGSKLLVDLGWVPTELRNKPEEFMPKGEVTITGSIMLGESPRFFTPTNRPDKNLWLWIDMQAFRKELGQELPEFFVMRSFVDNNYPLGKNVTPKLRNDHLGYAITWYGLALALILLVCYQRSWWPFQRNT